MLEQRRSHARSNGRMKTAEGVNCLWCSSANLRKFDGEVSIHVPGLDDLDRSPAWVFPKLVVCLDCGSAYFSVPETELRSLTEAELPVK